MMLLLLGLLTALAAPLSADEAVQLALSRSVPVARADADVAIAEGQVRASGPLRADPVIQARWAAVGDLASATLWQPLSLTGAGLAARRAARALQDATQASARRARLEVAAETRQRWSAAVEAQQGVRFADQALEVAARLRTAAEARYEAGEGSLLEARLGRLQHAEAEAAWMQAVNHEARRLADLSTWTGVAVAELELPDDPLRGMPAIDPVSNGRSDVIAAEQRLLAAERERAAERADSLPPVRLGAFAEQEGPEFRAGPGLTVTLPVWRANADARARAAAEVQAAQVTRDIVQRGATAEQATTRAALDRIETQVARAPPDDPRVEGAAALQSIAIGYDRGELDLITASLLQQQALRGQQAWLRGRRIRAEARIEAALAHEDERLLGRRPSSAPAPDPAGP